MVNQELILLTVAQKHLSKHFLQELYPWRCFCLILNLLHRDPEWSFFRSFAITELFPFFSQHKTCCTDNWCLVEMLAVAWSGTGICPTPTGYWSHSSPPRHWAQAILSGPLSLGFKGDWMATFARTLPDYLSRGIYIIHRPKYLLQDQVGFYAYSSLSKEQLKGNY